MILSSDLLNLKAAADYKTLAELQVELVDIIAQFLTVVNSLEKTWTSALLHRTRFNDPEFLARLSASLNLMSNSLRTGTAMPYYQRPLLEDCKADVTVRHLGPLQSQPRTDAHENNLDIVFDY